MNIYLLIKLIDDSEDPWDKYNSAVVVAPNEDEAKKMHPNGENIWPWDEWRSDSWVSQLAEIRVVYLGEASPGLIQGVVCSDFHAG